ncbi:WbqC family protein [Brevibacillus panacihumi]|uniref:WbqC family protein n=1 Tax=Brevibacillus panacihumi TaxID=497735 RepID=UPI003D229E81
MRVAIMQPYLFPYLGYFQLINTVDCFVIYDNVQFMKGGWINRNRILYQNDAYMFTFGVRKASYTLNINERYYSQRYEDDKNDFLRILQLAYRGAPNYSIISSLVEDILDSNERNVATLNTRSIIKICEYLNIQTKIIYSSKLGNKDLSLKGQDRVIHMVGEVGGKMYINLIGGTSLYSPQLFQAHSIGLSFLRMRDVSYKQFSETHVPCLSILDVLMFNSIDNIKILLGEFELI